MRAGISGDPSGLFYFQEDGSLTITAQKERFIMSSLETEIDILTMNDEMDRGFKNRYCAGLTMIPKMVYLQTSILTDMYQAAYK